MHKAILVTVWEYALGDHRHSLQTENVEFPMVKAQSENFPTGGMIVQKRIAEKEHLWDANAMQIRGTEIKLEEVTESILLLMSNSLNRLVKNAEKFGEKDITIL